MSCEFSNGVKKKILIQPLIDAHNKIKGVERLRDEQIVKTAQIGELGEMFWDSLATSSSNEVWNYDISPEFIMHFVETIK
jgi:hypothetical protein